MAVTEAKINKKKNSNLLWAYGESQREALDKPNIFYF